MQNTFQILRKQSTINIERKLGFMGIQNLRKHCIFSELSQISHESI